MNDFKVDDISCITWEKGDWISIQQNLCSNINYRIKNSYYTVNDVV